MDNIILIGMSGAGKSTLGVLLAKVVNKSFVDTDLVIQQKQDHVLQDIIINKGITVFKEVEEEVLLGLDVTNSVVATGGSVIYSDKGMNRLKQTGIVVYLHVPFSRIEKRLKNITTRGIVIEEGQSLDELYDEREPLYRHYADIVVNIGSEGIEDTLERILKKLK